MRKELPTSGKVLSHSGARPGTGAARREVLQKAIGAPRQSANAQTRPAPAAPPVYRPQPIPKVLQTKAAVKQNPPARQNIHTPIPTPVCLRQPTRPVLQARVAQTVAGNRVASNSRHVAPQAHNSGGAPKPSRPTVPRPASGQPAALGNRHLPGQQFAHVAQPKLNHLAAPRPLSTDQSRLKLTPVRRHPASNLIQRAEAVSVGPSKDAIIAHGKQAAAWVKSKIIHGAGNVNNAIKESSGRSYKAADKSKELQRNRGWRGAKEKYKHGTPEMVFFRAGTPLKARGGNCEEHADLTFVWLMRNTIGYTLNYVTCKDHAFIIIGDLKTESLEDCIVVDPWTTNAIVGRYGDGNYAQKVTGFEVKGVITGQNLGNLNAALRESKDKLGQVNTNYTADDKETYTDRYNYDV